ncbi:hypothetical protein L7F22_030323 [Adiantum nelumboides]|nr:hypothetical protein [Adiantum nelumboides]
MHCWEAWLGATTARAWTSGTDIAKLGGSLNKATCITDENVFPNGDIAEEQNCALGTTSEEKEKSGNYYCNSIVTSTWNREEVVDCCKLWTEREQQIDVTKATSSLHLRNCIAGALPVGKVGVISDGRGGSISRHMCSTMNFDHRFAKNEPSPRTFRLVLGKTGRLNFSDVAEVADLAHIFFSCPARIKVLEALNVRQSGIQKPYSEQEIAASFCKSIMPRRSGGGGRSARGARPPARSAPLPAPVRHAQPPAPVSGGGGSIAGGLGATIAQGMAFGTGSAMAHRAVDGLMGPRTVTHEYGTPDAPGSPSLATVSGSDTCLNQAKSFQDCINAYGSDIGKCQFYIDMLNECRRGPSSSMTL